MRGRAARPFIDGDEGIGPAPVVTRTVGPSGDYATIQAAVFAAEPGWLILVEDGTYPENVQVGKRGASYTPNGTLAEPIVLKSRNLHGAQILPPSNSLPGIGGGGAEYWTIDGFYIRGGKDAVGLTNNGTPPFSASGQPYEDPIRGITVKNCDLAPNPGSGGDPIHLAGGYDCHALDNICDAVGNDQGIDFGGISGGSILRNVISSTTGAAAGIVVKLGAYGITIADNQITSSTMGISCGDTSGDIMFNPDSPAAEATNCILTDNIITITGGYNPAIAFVGAANCTESGSIFTFQQARGAAKAIRVTQENAQGFRAAIYSSGTSIETVASLVIEAGNS